MATELRRRGIPKHEKGQPIGVAELDATGKVPTGQLPASVTGALEFKGSWDASGGLLPTPSGLELGWYYKISVAGTLSVGVAEVGDMLVCEDPLVPTWTLYQANWQFGKDPGDAAAIGSTLGASEIVETNGSSELVTAVKNTAHNKNFGNSSGQVPDIGTFPLNPSEIVQTDASSKLRTVPQGTAYNHNFGNNPGNVPGIDSVLSPDGVIVTAGFPALAYLKTLSKGSAFNKNFGTGFQTVCAGNDGRLSNARVPLVHKDSHDPEDGSDPLDCGIPGSIDETANIEGTAHSYARSDHNHQHLPALHENGGGAEISVTGLSGLLADDQHIIDSEAVGAMGVKADGNSLNHDKYLDSEAVSAMGAKADGNPLNHDRPVQATETVVGIAEIATQAETDAGTDDTRMVTPKKMAAHPALIFGSEFASAESTGESTHTGNLTPQTKTSIVMTSPPSGNYLIQWSCQLTGDDENKQVSADLYNGASVIDDCLFTPKKKWGDANESYPKFGGSLVVALSATTTFSLRYATNDAGKTVAIKNARMQIWRVS